LIIELIDTVVEELIDPESILENTFLRCQVLSYKLKNEKFKTWIDLEMNGYKRSSIIPEYRVVKCGIKGDMFMDLGFGNNKQLQNTVLPIQYFEPQYQKDLQQHKFTERISQLQKWSKCEDRILGRLPHSFLQEISEFTGDFEVISAKKIIAPNAVTGIISSIKSKLMTFLLELKEELGDKTIPLMKKNKHIDNILHKTFGEIRAENFSITIGDKNVQTISSGKSNIAQTAIENNTNDINSKEIFDLLKIIKEGIDKANLKEELKTELLNETNRIEIQISKPKPSVKILGQSLEVIKDLMTEVTGSAISQPILNLITQTMINLGM